MKKKGLIIATIVMVLVLAVSLTTATYAWFTVSDVTKIDAFNVSVVNDSAVRIGLKANNTYEAEGATNPALYKFGTLTYANQTPGQLGGGEWTGGESGLSDKLTHQIAWGEQKKAVGVTTETDAANATIANTGLWTDDGGKTAIAANGTRSAFVGSAVAARANNDGSTGQGDYVHMVLGVQAAKKLTTNEIVVVVDAAASEADIVGILAALHIAYRVDNGEWHEEQFFTGAWNSSLDDANASLSTEQANAYKKSYGVEVVPTTRAGKVVIELEDSLEQGGHISQVEMVIYIAGDDEDCVTEAVVSVAGAISIFFHTEVAAPAQNG